MIYTIRFGESLILTCSSAVRLAARGVPLLVGFGPKVVATSLDRRIQIGGYAVYRLSIYCSDVWKIDAWKSNVTLSLRGLVPRLLLPPSLLDPRLRWHDFLQRLEHVPATTPRSPPPLRVRDSGKPPGASCGFLRASVNNFWWPQGHEVA